MRRFRLLTTAALVPLLALLLGAPIASATSMQPQNLVDLVQLSERIMIGDVVDLRDGFDDRGVPYTEVTLRVNDSIRGDNGGTYTFRQFGLLAPRQLPDGTTSLTVSPDGWPRFSAGEEVMVFMYKPASQTGLQTTVGLLQGKFSVVGDQIVNGVNNANVFHDVQIDAKSLSGPEQQLLRDPSQMKASAFVSLVRRAVEDRWVEKGVISHAR